MTLSQQNPIIRTTCPRCTNRISLTHSRRSTLSSLIIVSNASLKKHYYFLPEKVKVK